MSKAVLISIRPEWCDKIVNGQKTIEIRKTRPKIETPFKCYIYETKAINHQKIIVDLDGNRATVYAKGMGKIIGEFICDSIETIGVPFPAFQNEMRKEIIEQSCMSYSELHFYAGHRSLYGWHISDLVIYDKPKSLYDFIKPGRKSIDSLDEDLCKYCSDFDYGEKAYYGTPDGPVMCEGASCDKAYQAYLDDEGFTLYRPPQSWCYVEEIE